MKKIKKSSPTFSRKDVLIAGLVIFLSWLALAALAYWKISPYTYKEFDTTCQHFSYNDCMRWFYRTLPYFTKVTVGSLIFAALTFIATLVFYFSKKEINLKCCHSLFILKRPKK